MNFYVYILQCSDKTFYTGWTLNLERRLNEHNSANSKTKYTRGKRPVSLVYYETYNNKSLAMRREWEIKQMSRQKKVRLISTADAYLKKYHENKH